MKSNVKRLFAGPYILWMIGFTIIPLLLIVYYGLTTKSGAFTLANVCSITTPEHMKALLLSLGLSLAATAICLLLSYPLALVLRRRGIGAGSFMVFVFILPMWMNFTSAPSRSRRSWRKMALSTAFFPFSICQILPSSIPRGRSFWVWYTTSCLS